MFKQGKLDSTMVYCDVVYTLVFLIASVLCNLDCI
jgi:hypothetical protein